MSDVMLLGVLRMPSTLWRDDPIDISQREGRYKQAADRIEFDAGEIERLNTRIAELEAERGQLQEAIKPLAGLSPYDCPYCDEHSLPVGADHNCPEVSIACKALARTDDSEAVSGQPDTEDE